MRESGYERPRIAVAGLNPHAGDNGNFGREEIDVIAPAIAAGQREGIVCQGPFPADTRVRARAQGRIRRGADDVSRSGSDRDQAARVRAGRHAARRFSFSCSDSSARLRLRHRRKRRGKPGRHAGGAPAGRANRRRPLYAKSLCRRATTSPRGVRRSDSRAATLTLRSSWGVRSPIGKATRKTHP